MQHGEVSAQFCATPVRSTHAALTYFRAQVPRMFREHANISKPLAWHVLLLRIFL